MNQLPHRPAGPMRFGVFEVDLESGELRKGGVRVRLQEKPFQVLVSLLERPGEVVSKEELKDQVWPDTSVELDLALPAAVTKIRRVLGDSADSPRYVETVPRRGYRFLVLPESRSESRPGIAVLPFQNLSGDSAQEYFSDGLTDALITELAKIRALRVISRTTVMQYKGAAKIAPEIAAELGVDAIVEGSVQREGEEVRVLAQLIDAENDNHLWAESYQRPLTKVFALQGQIAREVANEIHVNLTPNELGSLSTAGRVDARAFDLYLRGKHHAERMTPDGLRSALTYFQQSLEIDPSSAAAHAGLGMVFLWSTLLVMMYPREAGRRGYAEARRAVELHPESPQALLCLGIHEYFCQWDWTAAESSFKKAMTLSPNNADARLWYGLLATSLGRFDEGEDYVNQGLELDPLNLLYHHLAGVNALWAGKFEEAVERLRGVVARVPGMQVSHLTIWCGLHALGKLDEALKASIASWACIDDEAMVAALTGGATAGGYKEAMLRGGDVLAERFEHTYVPIYIMAMHYDFGGNIDKALDWIERGYEERDHAMSYINRKPFSEQMRRHPRFRAMLDRLQLPL